METHYTATVQITKTNETETDQYGKVKSEREVVEIAKVVVRGSSYENVTEKVIKILPHADIM